MRQFLSALRVYSELLWEHYHNPHHRERPQQFQCSARKVNPICPDIVELFLQTTLNGQVELYFVAEACLPAIAAASLLCQWSAGRSLEELSAVTEQTLWQWVGPLPPNKRHAVQLTFLALQELLSPRAFNPSVEGV